MSREGPDQIEELLDGVLREVLTEQPDAQTAARIRHLRAMGTILLGLACVCGLAVPFLPVGPVLSVGRFALLVTAIPLLLIGGWSIDRAGKVEVQAHRARWSKVFHGALDETPNVGSPAKVRRQRQYGIGMLVLGGFCMCVMVMPVPHKTLLDTFMWAAFAIALIWIGAWSVLRAAREAARAQAMLETDLLRQSARTGKHLQRVQ